MAHSKHWLGGTGNWADASAWSGDAVPTRHSNVSIDATGSYVVTVSAPAFAGTIVLDDAAATLSDMARLKVGGDIIVAAGTITVGGGGGLDSGNLVEVGYGGNGTLTVGHGGRLTASLGLQVGQSAGNTGIFVASGGAKISSAGTYQIFGNIAGAVGVGSVTGAHTQWDYSGRLKVGDYGIGTLTLADHATIAGGDLSVGELPGSLGTFTVQGGATLTTGGNYDVIGNFATSVGAVSVLGHGTIWTSASRIFVGYSGEGTLSVAGGATVNVAGGFDIGDAAGGVGTLAVGAGGTVSAPTTYNIVGDQAGSNGRIAIDGAGAGLSLAGLVVGSAGSGTLSLSNGGSLDAQAGLNVGDAIGGVGLVTIGKQAILSSAAGTILIGNGGSGTLDVGAGGSLASGLLGLGDYAGSAGTLSLSGSGANWQDGAGAAVGYLGSGTLDILNGATADVSGGFGLGIAYGAGGQGSVVVDGAAAHIASSLTVSGGFSLGAGGAGSAGTLTVSNGATVTVTSGSAYDGGGSAILLANGTFDVTGGDTIAAGATLTGYGMVGGGLTNDGQVQATGGVLSFAEAIGGTGTLSLGAAGTLSLSSGAGSGQTVDFLAPAGRLDLAHPLSFAGLIEDFAAGDQIDLIKTAATGYIFFGQQLTVLDGDKTVAVLGFAGDYSQANFQLVPDGHGGNFIAIT